MGRPAHSFLRDLKVPLRERQERRPVRAGRVAAGVLAERHVPRGQGRLLRRELGRAQAALAEQLGVTLVTGYDSIISNPGAARTAIRATMEVNARQDVIAAQGRYRDAIAALDALLREHADLEQKRSVSIADVERLLEPDCAKLAGAITGRALYDGRIDPKEALSLIRRARQAVVR